MWYEQNNILEVKINSFYFGIIMANIVRQRFLSLVTDNRVPVFYDKEQ